MKATVIATIEQLNSIGIINDGLGTNDLTTGSKVTIIDEKIYEHETLGQICEVEYLYEELNFHIPKQWLKIKSHENI